MKRFEIKDNKDTGERTTFDSGAVRQPTTGKGRFVLLSPFAMTRVALVAEKGEVKYTNGRNWEKGMPFSRIIDSAERHIQQYKMGLEDEDHLAQAAWNLLAILHYEELGMDYLDDMPHYLRGKDLNKEQEKK